MSVEVLSGYGAMKIGRYWIGITPRCWCKRRRTTFIKALADAKQMAAAQAGRARP